MTNMMAIYGATCPSWQGIDMPDALRRDDLWAETREKVSVCDHISQVEAGEGPQGQTMVRIRLPMAPGEPWPRGLVFGRVLLRASACTGGG